ncbi:MAG: cation:proton antiporter [Clostridia bacterium]|nr:cation:proton antiporter [Clostridia bacterium]MBO5433686.1 cation:proton antiporter [Clostridia bacterium]MBP3559249.1 cation:proton antiporter [Clostridia bacterium]
MLSNIITLNTFTDLGLMIFVGMALGRLVKKIKLPNVTGYLLAGLLLGPSILGLLSEEFLSGITVISDAALGFIAFSIGNEFKISYFKRVGATPIIIACLESFFAVAFVTVALMLAGCSTTFSLVLGSIAAATAPAATIMVIKQYKAKGPVTETLLSVVAIDDATALIMYSISIAAATALSGGNATVKELVLKPVIEIGGALVVGAILGFLFLLPMKAFKKDGNRLSLIIAFIFVGLGLSQLCGFSSLLLCMAMGAVVANFSPDVNQIMKLSDRITPPIFMLFFVASGADLKLSVLPAVGLVGVIYIVVRVVGKMFGASLGAIVCKAGKNIRKYLGPALVPQAGVAIGLSLAASSVVPEHASEIRTVILCGTLIYELVGPVIAKTCLKKAGEITEA